jgi:hypothetical protein
MLSAHGGVVESEHANSESLPLLRRRTERTRLYGHRLCYGSATYVVVDAQFTRNQLHHDETTYTDCFVCCFAIKQAPPKCTLLRRNLTKTMHIHFLN